MKKIQRHLNKTKKQPSRSRGKFLACLPRHSQSDKRGSHVGIVLSFAIFITFLIFMYSILEPSLRMERDKESTLDYLEDELIVRISSTLITATIRNDTEIDAGVTCIEFKDLLIDLDIDSMTIVKDKDKELVTAFADEDHLYVSKKEGSDVFYRLYNSEEFETLSEEFSGGCTGVTDCDSDPICQSLENEDEGYYVGDIFVGLVKESEKIFLSKIDDFFVNYTDDYDSLKNELKISPGTEFGFSFTYNNNTIVKTEEKETTENIYVREVPIEYLDPDANILTGFINIKVWG